MDKEVEAITNEFNEFAYMVSHDIQAPLRHIHAFTELLITNTKDKLNDNETRYLENIVDSTREAQNLVDGLLAFSRLNTLSEGFDIIDIESIIPAVITNLETIVYKEKPEITMPDKYPTVSGDKNQIITLLSNLMHNAIKFHKEDTQPTVTLNIKENGDDVTFEVIDEGIGIDEKMFSKIFTPCVKLHSDQSFRGVGMGLAIARKIAKRHNTDIMVTSKVDQGSTFSFTLKKA